MSSTYHHRLAYSGESYEWTEEDISPFDELLISWNAFRPLQGHYVISFSVKTEEWSPWIPYAHWGKDWQTSFDSSFNNIRSFQDSIELSHQTATGFKVRLECYSGANLESFFALHACATHLKAFHLKHEDPLFAKPLDIPPLSQIALNHPRNRSLCSPTSTTSVVRFLNRHAQTEPISFASQVYDHGFDIYGNWVFNVAQAFVELGEGWQCWVSRLKSAADLIPYLQAGHPVVVSLKGPLIGSSLPTPHQTGHLIVVRGYDPIRKQFHCMDPAFATDEETYVDYPLEDFTQAWFRRQNVAYLFSRH